MARTRKLGRGFTLIELMIVVAIIGIMTAICVPSFLHFECRAKQAEAKEMMKGLWLANEAYNGEFATYITVPQLTAFGGFGAQSLTSTKYYEFTVTLASASSYSMTALDGQNGRVAVSSAGPGDQWWMSDDYPVPTNTVDRCQY